MTKLRQLTTTAMLLAGTPGLVNRPPAPARAGHAPPMRDIALARRFSHDLALAAGQGIRITFE